MRRNIMEKANLPKVSVIMACYNAQLYLDEAIESILAQTYKDLELIIVDDGSTDASYKIALQKSRTDQRIKVYRNQKNMGQVFTRNKMLHLLSGQYIAVMDADDISHPDRIKQEAEWLDGHEEIDGISSGCNLIDESGNTMGVLTFGMLNPNEVRAWLVFDNPIIHSSAMFRRSLILRYRLEYRKGQTMMQDYGMWTKFVIHGNWIVLDKELIDYRVLKTSISHDISEKKRNIGINIETEIKSGYLDDFRIFISEKNKEIILKACSKFGKCSDHFSNAKFMAALIELCAKSRSTPFFKELIVRSVKIWKNRKVNIKCKRKTGNCKG